MAVIDHPIIGFRSFIPGPDLDGSVRSRFAFAHLWTPGVNQAECRANQHIIGADRIKNPVSNRVTDSVPSTECGCGFYAHHTIRDSREYQPGVYQGDVRPVFALVKGWGRIQVHYDGFRSQYQEILAIVPGEDADYDKQAARYYGVPYLTGDIETIASEFGKRAPVESRPTWEDTIQVRVSHPPAPLTQDEHLIVTGFVVFYMATSLVAILIAGKLLGKVAKHVLS
jgi:hypothetical protein